MYRRLSMRINTVLVVGVLAPPPVLSISWQPNPAESRQLQGSPELSETGSQCFHPKPFRGATYQKRDRVQQYLLTDEDFQRVLDPRQPLPSEGC